VDPHAVQVSLPMVLVRRLDRDRATRDVVAEFLQLLRFPRNFRLNDWIAVHVAKCHLQWDLHRSSSC
jgi:hypothetical protein